MTGMPAVHASASRNCTTGSGWSRWSWDSSASPRSCSTSNAGQQTGSLQDQDQGTSARPGRTGRIRRGRSPRGSVLGFFLGHSPGGGAIICLLCLLRHGEKALEASGEIRTGGIEGVAGPETANNAAPAGAFIPLLTLGIPSNVVMAMLLGALMIHGMQPGPLLIKAASGPVLGGRRQHVYRQRHAPGPQPSPHRHLGQDPEDPLSRSSSRSSSCSAYRGLQPEQQRLRHR